MIEAPAVLRTTRPSPLQAIAHAALTFALLALILAVLFPRVADADVTWSAFGEITWGALAAIVVVFAFTELLKALPYVVLVPRLGVWQSFVANEASTTISNTIPGPSGTAATYLMFRSWGFNADDFGKAVIVNSVWNNAVLLVFPVVAMLIYGPGHDVDGYGFLIAVAGVVIALICGAIIVGIARSVGFARRVGVIAGHVVTWARGIIGRPRPEDFGDAVVKFRTDVMETVASRWLALTIVILVKYLAAAWLLLICLRAVGVGSAVLNWREILVAYAIVRLLTVIQITPGGVGVTEFAYAAVLEALAGAGTDVDSAIVAGTLLFRGFTYVAPIIVGIPCYLVWRMKKRWRVQAATLSEGPTAFATAGFRATG